MRLTIDAAADWRRYGEEDPYFGVLSQERYRGATLDASARDEFFASGVRHVAKVQEIARHYLGWEMRGRALDFGCGVGRVSQALAPHFDEVVGLDVAPGMLDQARANASREGVGNLVYAESRETDLLAPESYDFIHCYIVLQHMPVREGRRAIDRLVRSVKIGGVGAIHITTRPAGAGDRARLAVKNATKSIAPLRFAANLAAGRPLGAPAMQMNCYRITDVTGPLAAIGEERFVGIRIDDWGSEGLFFFFQRAGAAGLSPWSNPRHAR